MMPPTTTPSVGEARSYQEGHGSPNKEEQEAAQGGALPILGSPSSNSH